MTVVKKVALPFMVTGTTVLPVKIGSRTVCSVLELRRKFTAGEKGKFTLVEGASVLRRMGIPTDGTYVKMVKLIPDHTSIALKDLERHKSFVATVMSMTYVVRDPDRRDKIRQKCFDAVKSNKMAKVSKEIQPQYPGLASLLLSKEANDVATALNGGGSSAIAKFDIAYLEKFYATHKKK